MRLKVQVTIDIHTKILDHSRIGYNSTAETERHGGQGSKHRSRPQHQHLRLFGIEFHSVMTEPLVHTAQGLFDASNEALNILFPAANQQLGIVGVLHNGYLAGHTQAQVVSEQHIQDTAESPTLEDADIVVSRARQHVPPTSRAHTNLLGVVRQVALEPLCVDTIERKLISLEP